MRNFVRKDDQGAVLNEVGPSVMSLLREAVDDGFYSYAGSRDKDPDAFPDYSDSTRANMLYDRIAATARQLTEVAGQSNPDLNWQISANKRATEVLLDTRFAFRIKRSKKNRGGKTSSVWTRRQRRIMSDTMLPAGQMILAFPSRQIVVADEDRIWLTVAFDLDELEEHIESVFIGVELRKRFLWKVELPEPDADALATIQPELAERITELRNRRLA